MAILLLVDRQFFMVPGNQRIVNTELGFFGVVGSVESVGFVGSVEFFESIGSFGLISFIWLISSPRQVLWVYRVCRVL